MNAVKGAVASRKIVLVARGGRRLQEGKIGWILLWLVGIPIPVLLVLFLLRGCT